MSQKNYYEAFISSFTSSSSKGSNDSNNRSLQKASSSSLLTVEDSIKTENNITSSSEADFATHKPVSPPSGVEQFFLPALDTTSVSAHHLASEIKKEQKASSIRSKSSRFSSAGSLISAATEDFHSTCDTLQEDDLQEDQNLDGHEELLSSPGNSNHKLTFVVEELEEASVELASEREEIKDEEHLPSPKNTNNKSSVVREEPEETPIKLAPETEEIKEEINMTDIKTPETTTTPPATMGEKKEELHLDATQHVYEAAKNVWGFGKNIFFVKPFLGLTEAIATKVVGELKDVDDAVKPHIANIDNSFFNPAVNAVVSFVMPVVEKVDPIVRPVYTTVLKPFGLFKEAPLPVLDNAPTPATETEEKKVDKLVIEKKEEKKTTEPEVTVPAPVS